MSYLVLLPCLLFVFTVVSRHGYPGISFVLGTALLGLVIAGSGFMAPGADALLATSLSMCLFHLALWYWGPTGGQSDIADDSDSRTANDTKPFCALSSHDFALPSSCLLYTSPSPRDATLSRMPSSA